MNRKRRIPKFSIEDLDGREPETTADLDAVLAKARERGGRREVCSER
jgi:hypothetical protein